VHSADRDDDVVGCDTVTIGDETAKVGIALRAAIGEREVAERHAVEDLGETEIRPDAFGEIVARGFADQRNDVVLREPPHVASSFVAVTPGHRRPFAADRRYRDRDGATIAGPAEPEQLQIELD
jgi:hypothetical protein